VAKASRVPRATGEQLVHDWPSTCKYGFFPNARHVGSWNVDPERYEQDVRDFLDRVLR